MPATTTQPAAPAKPRISVNPAARVPLGDAQHFFNEFAYHRVLDFVNRRLADSGRTEFQIKTTRARAIRDKVDAEMERILSARGQAVRKPGFPCDQATRYEMMRAILSALDTEPGVGDIVAGLREDRAVGSDSPGSASVDRIADEFGMYTGIVRRGAGIRTIPRPMLPLSPYDKLMSGRKAFIDNGSRLLYADARDIARANMVTYPGEAYDAATNPRGAISTGNVDAVFSSGLYLHELGTVRGQPGFRSVGPAFDPDDLSGVSALRPYMSDAEYAAITVPHMGSPWCNAATRRIRDRNGNVRIEPMYMSPQSIQRAAAVAAALRAEGADFKFEPDSKPGQVKMQFPGGMNIRIIDPYAERMAGSRVYKDGRLVYYSIQNEPGSAKRFVEYDPQSTEECLALIHHAMGRPVPCIGDPDHIIGQPVPLDWSSTGGSKTRRSASFHNAGSFRAYAGRIPTGRTITLSDKTKVPETRALTIYYNDHLDGSYSREVTPENAEAFLRDAVRTARENFGAEIGIESILAEYAEHKALGDLDEHMPAFSSQPDIAALQSQYWEYLVDPDESVALLKPGYTADDFESADDLAEGGAMYYTGPDKEAIVRAHLSETMDAIIGTFDPGIDGKRFDPVKLARYMSNSGGGVFRNTNDLVSAARYCGLSAEDMRGSAFDNNVFNGRLVRFDPESAVPIFQHESAFVREMGLAVRDGLRSNGCSGRTADILIDRNGVVSYTMQRVSREGYLKDDRTGKLSPITETVHGEIGRILAPDANGVVCNGSYYFVPGYVARIEPNKPGEDKPYEERIALTGYKELMKQAIGAQLRDDLLKRSTEVGDPVALDSTMRKLYDTRYPLDFYERTEKDGMDAKLRDAIIKTNKARVRFPNEAMDESGRVSLHQARSRRGADPLDDYKSDAAVLTDGRNLVITEAPGDGLFDKYFTGNGGGQGVRFLAEGAEVDADGHIVPAEKGARCAIVNYLVESGRCPDFDSADRMIMTGQGLLQCLRETGEVGVAQASFGGHGFEDGIVVSQRFADANMVLDKEGNLRPLGHGDKIECHGNKGVIATVIDPDMPLEQARELGIEKQVLFFRSNPGLDVVMSPYSPVSRFNAGLAREAMDNEANPPSPLVLPGPEGTVVPGGIGHVKLTVLKQTADAKTRMAEDGSVKRSYGAQMGWALAANDCQEVMRAVFADNRKAVANLREMLIVTGMDLDPTGRFQVGYHPHPGEQRNMFEMEPLRFKSYLNSKGSAYLASQGYSGEELKARGAELVAQYPDKYAGQKLDKSGMKKEFGDLIDKAGGFVEVPFPLAFPDKQLGRFKEIPRDQRSQGSVDAYPHPTYAMPLMSSFMRSGQDFDEGESIPHDYTAAYQRIYEKSLDYRAVMADEGMKPDEKAAKLAEIQGAAQKEYNRITRDIVNRRFQGKHNVFRSDVMANKQAKSATAIWSPDPNLSLDEIGINPEMARILGAKDGDYLLVHRDPMLQASGIRYMRCRLDERLVGISVNPVGIPGGMDGDFDGDTVGVTSIVGPDAKAARSEAMRKLSVANNLLDRSTEDEHGDHDLFVATGQDMAAAWAARPELKEEHDRLRKGVNELERHADRLAAGGAPDPMLDAEGKPVTGPDGKPRSWTMAAILRERRAYLDKLNTYVQACNDAGFARHVLDYSSPEALVSSIDRFVEDGAKGSKAKVDTFAKFAGITYERDAEGRLVPGSARKEAGTLSSREDNLSVMKAKNMQQVYTGFAGKYSIRAMKAFMNVDPDTVTRLCKLATQGVVQVKHSSEQADTMEAMLTGPCRAVWRGYQIQPGTEEIKAKVPVEQPGGGYRVATETRTIDTWVPVRDEQGQPKRATVEQFKENFMAVYGSKKGLGLPVSKSLLDKLGTIMNDGKGGCIDLEGDAVEKYAAPLQICAYDGTFKDVIELAHKMEADPSCPGLFEVPATVPKNYNICMADYTVMRRNLAEKARAAAKGEAPDYVPLVKPDTVIGYDIDYRKPRPAARRGGRPGQPQEAPPAPPKLEAVAVRTSGRYSENAGDIPVPQQPADDGAKNKDDYGE